MPAVVDVDPVRAVVLVLAGLVCCGASFEDPAWQDLCVNARYPYVDGTLVLEQEGRAIHQLQADGEFWQTIYGLPSAEDVNTRCGEYLAWRSAH